LILLLAGYDKAAEASDSHQDKEIKLARKRLAEYRRETRVLTILVISHMVWA
jgi:hypothetical protein